MKLMGPSRHIKLTLEYDGTNYAGWQSQTNARAIQDVVSEAVETMTQENGSLLGSSRTDAGVHAYGQVATFKTTKEISCLNFQHGLNSLLPPDIRVKRVEEVAEDFHPIKNAKQKTYAYRLDISESPCALDRNRVHWVGPKIDVEKMKQGATYLVGEHDFKSFQASDGNAKSTVRTIYGIRFSQESLTITFTGNGFLKQMIRNIVGTLIEVGEGKRHPEEVMEILAAKDRRKAGVCAPAHALYLLQIEFYPIY